MFNTPHHLLNNTVKVSVVGCGGTGSYVLSMLAQMHYLLNKLSDNQAGLFVTAYDDDTVSEFNCGRQNFYMMDVGLNKAEVLMQRINIGFGSNWRAIAKRFDISDFQDDVLITCVDNIKTRVDIGQSNTNSYRDTFWIDGGNGESDGQVILGHLNKKAEHRLANFYDIYADTLQDIVEDERDSCSHADSLRRQDWGVNHQSALMICQLLWRMLRHGKLDYHGTMFDLKAGESVPFSL
ncbi:PRTRC system ThiF family protein [Thalassotalea marina]|uniref:THIF-type NAD/FAD binding fold domain-containing protein n=1 Tax=Thalassotalea marina TaxID=1673741 RepID=A0A919BRI7_9GAMM|nr:PRTRC system ThiF family protein [Thalassotalea marina]GHG07716.1 hypothetical protein GCM10017161_41730 [Thalassotalea marina]